MSSAAISIRNLGKRYRVNHAVERAPYRTLRDSLARAATATWRRLRGETNGASEDFWALKDVEFDVQPGEVVGIIGRNGAGKSTLLKILSRITSPTTGEVEINGRVGSLLEVGTGFHPELTGRENIYMNGSILGMTRQEIRRNFDAIIEFSGVEQFLDTPVKRYSSGMYVRLAFAVAAHLESEILIVDEVLAVGDMAFQKKCVGKLEDVSRHGRTVLFVSHNMAAVRKLCNRAVVLQMGRVAQDADVNDAVSLYLDFDRPPSGGRRSWPSGDAPGNDAVRLLDVVVEPANGPELDTDSGFVIRWTFETFRARPNLGSTLQIRNADDVLIIQDGVRITAASDSEPAVYQAEMRFPPLLNAGRYKVGLMFGENRKYLLFHTDNVLAFDVSYKASDDRLLPSPGLITTKFQSRVRVRNADRQL